MNYTEFQDQVHISREAICREVFDQNRKSIKVKKEHTVVKNLNVIFSAALKISNKKGFQAMSMRDLSRETGLSMGALYSYFSSKDELLEMLQHLGRTLTSRTLEQALRDERDPLQLLRAAVRTHLYLSEAMQPWFYFSYMEAKHLSRAELEKAVASELETEQMFAGILEEGARQGIFRKHNHQLTASMIKALLQDWYLKRKKYAKRNMPVDDYAASALEFVECYVLTAKGAQNGGLPASGAAVRYAG